MDRVIREAISKRRLIQFNFDGFTRVAEPHDYGIHNGLPRVFVYQVSGGSKSGKIPDWRLVTLAKASEFKLLDETFPGTRATPTGKHLVWDVLYASVSRGAL